MAHHSGWKSRVLDHSTRFALAQSCTQHDTEDERQRAILVQMARTWLALAQKGATNADRAEGLDEETN
jgi:hypothetical protein